MQEYVYYVQDDRQASPVQRRVKVRDYDEAWKLGERILRETYHHLSVDVWTEGQPVLSIRSSSADPVG